MASHKIPCATPLKDKCYVFASPNVTTKVTVTSETNPALDMLLAKVLSLECQLEHLKTLVADLQNNKKRNRTEYECTSSSLN